MPVGSKASVLQRKGNCLVIEVWKEVKIWRNIDPGQWILYMSKWDIWMGNNISIRAALSKCCRNVRMGWLVGEGSVTRMHAYVLISVQSCLTICHPMDCGLPGFSVHGVSQPRIVEWVAISFSRASTQPRDWTWVSCIGRWILHHWAAWGPR